MNEALTRAAPSLLMTSWARAGDAVARQTSDARETMASVRRTNIGALLAKTRLTAAGRLDAPRRGLDSTPQFLTPRAAQGYTGGCFSRRFSVKVLHVAVAALFMMPLAALPARAQA